MIRSTCRRHLVTIACAAGAALAAAQRASAQQVQAHWLTPSSGEWTVPGNWSTNPFFPDNGQPTPTTTYLARIAAAGAPYEVGIRSGAVSPAGITVDGLVLDSADATVRLTTSAGTAFRAAQFVRLDAGTFIVDGGTLRNTRIEGTGGQLIGRGGELDAVTLAADMIVPNNTPFGNTPALTVRNGLALDNATVTLVRGESSTLGTAMRFDGAQTIAGTGTILLTGPTGTGTGLSPSPFVSFNDGTVTLGSGLTMRGGAIVSGTGGTFVNEGTVVADDPDRILQFWHTGSLSVINRGVIEARSGTRLQIERPFKNEGVVRADGGGVTFGQGTYPTSHLGTLISTNGGTIGIGGQLDNTGATLTATETTGDLWVGTVTGGTVATNGSASFRAGYSTYSSLTLTGRVLAQPLNSGNPVGLFAHDVTLDGGTIVLNGAVGSPFLSSSVNSTLAGVGSVLLAGASESNQIRAQPGVTFTLGPGITVRATDGGGTIGFETGSVVNCGAILADSATSRRLWLQRVTNEGSITVTHSSRLLATDLDNRGLLRVGGTSATFNGTWTNAGGRIEATGGASLELQTAPSSWGDWNVSNATVRFGALFNLPNVQNVAVTTAQLGQMELNNATLAVGFGGRIDNAAQTLNLSGNSLLLAGGTLSGGTLTRSGAERAAVAAGRDGAIDGVTIAMPLAVERSARLFSAGDIVLNNGQVVVESSAGSRSIVYFNFAGPAAVTGAGEIRFTGGGTHGSVAMPSGGLTIGPNVTARTDGGNGSFGDPFNPSGPLVNQGSIRSQSPGNYVRIDGTFTNHGTVRVTGGGSFAAERGFTNHGTFAVGTATAARVTLFGLLNHGTVALDGTLIVRRAPGSTITELLPQLVSGYAGGAWNGPGINSPAAAATPGFGVGIADSVDLFATLPATFHGQVVTDGSTLFHFTLLGDADMDGTVGLGDFNRLASHFGETGAYWARGDFNYDGRVNLQDFNLLAGNFGLQAAGPNVAPQNWSDLAAVVPEPGAVGALASLALLVLPRQRRRP